MKICKKCLGIIDLKHPERMGYKSYSSRWSKYCICKGRDVDRIEKKLMQKAFPKKQGCIVCKHGWKAYRGNYDELCDKHYLRIEPTR